MTATPESGREPTQAELLRRLSQIEERCSHLAGRVSALEAKAEARDARDRADASNRGG